MRRRALTAEATRSSRIGMVGEVLNPDAWRCWWNGGRSRRDAGCFCRRGRLAAEAEVQCCVPERKRGPESGSLAVVLAHRPGQAWPGCPPGQVSEVACVRCCGNAQCSAHHQQTPPKKQSFPMTALVHATLPTLSFWNPIATSTAEPRQTCRRIANINKAPPTKPSCRKIRACGVCAGQER